MKIIVRTFIILAAALVVVSALVALSNSGIANGLLRGPGRDGFGPRQFDEAAPGAGFRPDDNGGQFRGDGFSGGFDREGGRGPNLLGLGQVIQSGVIVGIIAVIAVLGARALRMVRGAQTEFNPAEESKS